MLGKKYRDLAQEKVLFPIGRIIAKTGVSPNQITLASVPLALASAWFIINGNLVPALFFMVLSIFFDNLDGAVAKSTNQTTLFGNYLDAMMDRYVELILISAFAFTGLWFESILALGGSLLPSYAKARVGLIIPSDNSDWPAIGDRADRLLILITGTAAAVIYPVVFGYSMLGITLLAIAFVSHVSTLQRMAYAAALISKHEETLQQKSKK
ncbi:MAG: CDP-alcohol phosphatidyltransferase family protein [Candidatus Diapherotrites archaeon]|nr:CDP-alcohol phosphatidyltransferase family protein [Candidatus Diapherotrites archaeon]